MKKYDPKEALEKRKIISFSAGPNLIFKELEAAKEDLLDAKDLFSRERFKSATTLAYYTIFHMDYYDNFIQALDFREMADYKSKFSREGAERNIQAAKEAIRLTENLLKNKKS